MEDDFPFSFGGGSDQEGNNSGDDGLFCAPKDKKKAAAKAKALLNQGPYHAQIDEDGWFHNTRKTTYELMTQSKTGATKVKMRADHYYMLHRYQEAFDIAQDFCELVRMSGNLSVSQGQNDGGFRRTDAAAGATTDAGVLKVSDPKEMQEMALRCALKLNLFDVAASLADELAMHDTGIVFLKAKAYVAVDAALGLVQYQRSRTGNYSIWRTLGECLRQSTTASPSGPLGSFVSTAASTSASTTAAAGTESLPSSLDTLAISLPSSTTTKPTVVHILALMCILRARYLMRISTWAQVPYAQARYDNEMSILDEQRVELERKCGLDLDTTTTTTTTAADETAVSEDEQWQEQRRLEEYELKVVAPARKFVQEMNERGATAFIPHQDQGSSPLELEVVEFVVKAWDAQVVALSESGATPRITTDDDDLAGEVGVRDK
ncbi:hypothetical protein KI688_012688 [Linnemannia hyalina]|uniref:Uncharacterized protein n=1 Tax=Linnemannia hyalina TaxID=64524 RepID=A0A9P8BVB9_9FUNG|nr:hypothetical protein KI688_012688 [Linnemannia hyalina]